MKIHHLYIKQYTFRNKKIGTLDRAKNPKQAVKLLGRASSLGDPV